MSTQPQPRPPEPSPEAAARILLARQAAYDSLVDYARLIEIPGVPPPELNLDDPDTDARWEVVETPLAPHHELILTSIQDLLEDRLVYDGQTVRRLMLMFPPGSAKSTYASVVAPTWVMGRDPTMEIILAGYGDTIVKRHGKRARQICASAQFSEVFNTQLDPDTKAADSWALTNGAGYKGAGITAGITGFRTGLLIWDDLVKGREAADSANQRQKIWDAYLDDARSRKTPRAHEIGIGTRWHEDDHMGRILPEGYNGESGFMHCRDGNVWLVLCCPAEAERDDDPLDRAPGQMLWEEWFDEDYWRDKRVNPRSWASLYQQRPAPEEGLYFKREQLRRYTDLPSNLNIYIAYDPAVSGTEEGDSTAIQVWGVDEHTRMFLVDEWVARATMDVWIAQLVTMAGVHKPLAVVSEAGVIRRASEPYLHREMRERRIFMHTEWVNRGADKSAMARPYQAMVSAGNVYLPSTSVGDAVLDELLRFPTSKDDHRVDAGANLCLYLEKVWAANPPRPAKEEPGVLEHGLRIKDLMPERFPRKRSKWAMT